jgi:hypothetical protein
VYPTSALFIPWQEKLPMPRIIIADLPLEETIPHEELDPIGGVGPRVFRSTIAGLESRCLLSSEHRLSHPLVHGHKVHVVHPQHGQGISVAHTPSWVLIHLEHLPPTSSAV